MDAGDVIRNANEQIERLNASFDLDGSADARYDYLCECADLGCMQPVGLTRAEYRAVRMHPRRFLVAPGHLDAEVDRVVEQTGSFAIVEKIPADALEEAR